MKDIWSLRRNQKGFTLVELLVVIAIIGVLATLVLLQLGTARARARDTQRIATVNQIRSAIELFIDSSPTNAPPAVANITTLCTTLVTGNLLASCPTTMTGYGYRYHSTNRGYVVWASLETQAAALNSDADIPAASTNTGDTAPSTNEAACTSANLCIYDQGNR